MASWRDLTALRHLEKECFPKDAWPLLDLVGVLSMPNVLRLKAVIDGQMVGFIACDIRRAENVAWIATIGVLPELRRQGIGERLLLEARGQAERLCHPPQCARLQPGCHPALSPVGILSKNDLAALLLGPGRCSCDGKSDPANKWAIM
jgi:ribosomal protein S18 acetylase RimI-like enzyme